MRGNDTRRGVDVLEQLGRRRCIGPIHERDICHLFQRERVNRVAFLVELDEEVFIRFCGTGLTNNFRIGAVQRLTIRPEYCVHNIGRDGMATVGKYGIALCHIQRRRITTPERERAVTNQCGVTETKLGDVIDRIAEPGLEQQQPHRYKIHRSVQRFSQACRSVESAAVIYRSPDRLKFRRADNNRCIKDYGCQRVAEFKRRRVNKGLECGSGLAICLRRTIVLARSKIESADQAADRTILRIERDNRGLRLRNLRQCPGASRGGHDQNKVSGGQDIGHRLGCRAERHEIDERISPRQSRPRNCQFAAIACNCSSAVVCFGRFCNEGHG